MRLSNPVLSASAISLAAIVTTRANASEIWVITDSVHPAALHADVRHIQLDAAEKLLATLSAGLSSDPPRATAEAAHLVQASPSLYQQLAVAYQGVIDTWSIGVTAVPAVVVDRRYVVYGEPNVERALQLIRTFQESGK